MTIAQFVVAWMGQSDGIADQITEQAGAVAVAMFAAGVLTAGLLSYAAMSRALEESHAERLVAGARVGLETLSASDKFAIGNSGIGYKTEGVRTVPLAVTFGRECYDTSAEATYSGNYPIARYLYIYFNKKPNEPIDPLRGEFIKYVLSREGQAQTEKSGFYPLTNEMREKELRRLGLPTLAN